MIETVQLTVANSEVLAIPIVDVRGTPADKEKERNKSKGRVAARQLKWVIHYQCVISQLVQQYTTLN